MVLSPGNEETGNLCWLSMGMYLLELGFDTGFRWSGVFFEFLVCRDSRARGLYRSCVECFGIIDIFMWSSRSYHREVAISSVSLFVQLLEVVLWLIVKGPIGLGIMYPK